ncbi:MAG: Ig-like domain-containing protein [Firmicutes bacterium]|nr:Ig-like domain-containing protein [Bacillota bacterium]
MRKRILSILLSASMAASLVTVPIAASAEANTPTYQTTERKMEKLDRGLVAVKVTGGVYLSWRLLGDEDLTSQEYDIYRDDTLIYTTENASGTNYTDSDGTTTSEYKVVKHGADASGEEAVTPWNTNTTSSSSVASYSEYNSMAYMDVAIQNPGTLLNSAAFAGDEDSSKTCTYTANDASVGDIDGDGEYEIILKWDPSNSKDSAGADYTGRVFVDAYEMDGTFLWRIDLGYNVTAGAHYTQFMVYDFDGDGYAEVAMKTAPGSKDGQNTVNEDGTWNEDGGEYVSLAGDTDEIRNVSNTTSFIGTSGSQKGKNPYTQYLTIFDGATGAALATTEYIPYDTVSSWGDSTFNRSERYLAAVAYLDGVTPSLIMCRGYYAAAVIRAYTWDGEELNMQWQYVGSSSGESSLYGQGNHNLSIGDIDGDGCDEIVYGSAALDNDGKTVMGNTQLGHGDAMHMSDFNNDGEQEVFSVKEDSEGYKYYAMDLRNAATGEHFWDSGVLTTSSDNGRGVMDNIDDAYAAANPESGLALGWDSGHDNAVDLNGNEVAAKPVFSSRSGCNFLVYWDGDLGREILDDTLIGKYYAQDGTNSNGYSVSAGTTLRFYNGTSGYTLYGASSNNDTKYNPCLVADLFGDWREEIIMRYGDDALRIYMSTIPSDYRLTTLMHDSQYRMSVAWQNVAYNQPTHTSYYIGSAALATDESGETLNYLAPAVAYTKVTYSTGEDVAVTGLTLSESSIQVERTKSYTLNASLTPTDATTKGIIWTSSDTSVATVANGIVKGVGEGTATITATSKDETNGTISASCTVEVYSTPVTSVTLADKSIDIGMGYTKTLSATVAPSDATDTSLTWTSADETVATVDEDGVVTGVSYGKTTITATNEDSGLSAQCIVKVKPIDSTDMTGDDVFVTSNTTDDTISYTGTSTTAAFTLTQATVPVEFHKDFEPYSDNKAILSYKFTTGGSKDSSTGNYIWIDGHTYNTELKLLDTDGNNILNIIEYHTTSGVSTMFALADGEESSVSSAWTLLADGDDNPLNRSQIRWDIEIEFDYNQDVATITLAGCNSSWEKGKTYQYSFDLNGASFKTLKYETNEIADYVSGSPSLKDCSYVYETTISGETETVYESGTENVPMTSSTVDDWVQTGTDTAELAYDSENDRILYNPTQPGAEYYATKTFDALQSVDSLITYDVDWYFGSAVNRDGNFEYIQFGDYLRIGWTNGYVTWVSTDGGKTWIDSDEDGTADSIFTGSNTTYTKNIKVIFDPSAKQIKAFYFDGSLILSDYTYSDSTEFTIEDIDSVTFGFTRGGQPPAWEVPNGIDSIKVTQFIEGEETPDFTAVTITGISDNTVSVDYDLVNYSGNNAQVIGALYDENGILVEVKAGTANTYDDISESIVQGEEDLTFTNDPTEYNLKVYLWDSVEGMVPIVDAAERESGAVATAAPTASPTPTVDPNATESPSPSPTASPTPSPSPTAEPTPSPTPTVAPTIDPDVTYEEVFTSSESFLMEDDTTNNKWIISYDGTTAAEAAADSSKTVTASEISTDIGGNDTAKLYLANKAVEYVLDEAVSEGCFKLTYDMYIDKSTNASGYGRYFRTYLDNAAHDYDAATGKASVNDTSGSFFHMMDYYDTVYTTSSVDLLSANQNSSFTTGAIQLSETALEDAKWYRVVIEGDLDNDVVIVSYYAHGDSYNADLDISTETPVISANGCFTDDRTRSIKQIKLMRTAGGDLYYDNIKLEKETADTTGGETDTGSESDSGSAE